jgi:hypothetical protein
MLISGLTLAGCGQDLPFPEEGTGDVQKAMSSRDMHPPQKQEICPHLNCQTVPPPTCPEVLFCADECTDGDRECALDCMQHTTEPVQLRAKAVLECVFANDCWGVYCMIELCPAELIECFMW